LLDPNEKDDAFHERTNDSKTYNMYTKTTLDTAQQERLKNNGHNILTIYEIGNLSKTSG
jgi:hypothetical protein